MKKTILFFIGITTFIGLHAQYNMENLQPKYGELRSSEDNLLKIYPIKANKTFTEVHKNIDKFSNLEDAIKEKKIRITEVSSSGTVNTLYAQNISSETIYLMAGEIVKGGKQDRIIGMDVIILPNEKKNISAFCVERGRWSAKSSGSNFNSYSNGVSQNVRKAAVIKKNQSEVWSNVSQINSRNKVSSSTGAYTALEESKEYNSKMQKYLKAFESAWNNDPEVVGMVAVSGNKVIGCDLFATHDIFENAYNNLLQRLS